MRTLQDPLFGSLSYEYGWIGNCRVQLWGDPVDARLFIPCDEDIDIEDAQRQAYSRYVRDKETLLQQAREEIFSHYQRVVPEYRSMLGPEFADKMAPIVHTPEQLASLVRPTELIVQQTFGSRERVVGLLCDCSWAPSLGLAVKFVNEEIAEIGPQDIVL